ncbi:DUF2567 domain-containing protein [Modestobacter sp. VKM Ac-2984]|uniref:DUF2567 domain-containing protein n=1 Tax=Modestobacter sp. VKM Ac-2984 TaxID=3004138 RepID=UPI0022AB0CCC|nr:DUF2567 domain-containing protein [Modestobacter sp. VKM Ac-2984]MCZ2814701.1 DUF2567 domain-containing protein [Modestobacter sp. VKM Ac-2984]
MTDPRTAGPAPGAPAGPGALPASRPATPPPGWVPQLPATRAGWAPGLRGSREDVRTGLITVLALTVAGLGAGALWAWLAPRADYRVTETQIVPVVGVPSAEVFFADDGVYVLVLAGLGVLAGVLVWLIRRRRGVPALVGLAGGMVGAGVVAWQLGELLGAGPTEAELAEVGGTITTGVDLAATAALAIGPFAAVLTYLVATALTPDDDLGRPDDTPRAEQQLPPRPPLPPVPPAAPRRP